jgi:fibronectin-binding autotransporter adhesin
MKIKTTKSSIVNSVTLLALLILAAVPAAQATNYTWDFDGNFANGNTDGSGTWNTSSTLWNNTTTDVAWPSSPATTDVAAFGTSANTASYTVTVNQSSSGVTVNNITFNDMANTGGYGNYTIAGSGASGTINAGATASFIIFTGKGGTNTISAPIAGTLNTGGQLVIGRSASTYGNLVLSGANTITPSTAGTIIRQGTVFINSINTVNSVTNNTGGNSANQSSSSLGSAVSTKSTIAIGYNGYSAALVYTGSGEGTDRPFMICAGTPASGGSGTIQNDGTGPLVLAGAITTTATAGTLATRPFTLQGANTGLNEVKSIISDASASLLLSLTKAGAGNWTLSGANTYSGGTTISGGTLKIGSDGNLGTAPSSPTAGNLVINNATLEIISPMALNANRGIALGASSGTVSGFLQLDSGANVTYAGIMANNGSGTGNLYLSGTAGATLTLSGPSTFTGNILNRGNILSVTSINTAGTVVNAALPGGQSTHQSSSNLGAPTSASTGSIQLGYNAYTGTLLYTGSGEGTDRNIIIGNTSNGGTGGGAVIQNDGSGPMVFSGTFTAGGASASANHNKTLTLQGSNTGANQIASAIPDGAANGSFTAITSLTKAGGGTWQLTAANSYSGNTTVSSGILALSGSGSVANTPIIGIAGGATLDVSGLNSTFTLGSSQTLTNRGVGAILNGNLNTGSGTNSLVFDGTNQSFIVTNGTLTLSASTTFSVTKAGGVLPVGVYKIISKATSGNTGSVGGTLPSVILINGANQASLGIVDGELYLTNGSSSAFNYTGSSFTYNGSSQTPVIAFSGSTGLKTTNYVGVAPTSYGPTVNAPVNAGTYYVSNTVAADANYFGATNMQTFTISAKAASVTADAKTKTYGDANPTLTAVTNGAVNGDVINVTIATDATQYSAVGQSNITVTAGSNPNYTVLTTNSTLTIGTRPITITAQPNTKIYDGGTSATNVPTLTAGTLASSDGFSSLSEVYSDPAVGTGKTVIPSATITNASGTATANYAITPVNNTASVINPAQATTSLLLTNNVGLTNDYGQTLIFTAVVETNSVNAVNASSNVVFSLGSTPVWTNAVVSGVAYYTNDDLTVGVTNFTAQYLGDNNYLGSSVTVTQTVLPTTPLLTLTASAITYGQTLGSSSLTGSVATNGYDADADGDEAVAGNFAFADNTIAPNAGVTNVWVIFTPTDTTNYTAASNTVAVTVNKANSTVTVTGTTSFTYNGAGQGPASASVTGSGGLVGYNYSGTGYGPSADVPTNAGSYTVTVTVAADANYFGVTNSQSFTIGAKAASVTADAKTKTYGDANPTLTATVAGTVNGDVLNYTLATDATQFSSVGVSNITVTLGSNPNYSVHATNSTLTINPASTFVGASSSKNPSGYKDSVSYIATLPNDATGSVVFSSTNGPISTNTLSGGSATSLSITNLPRGTNVITVTYLGDGNYLGSTTNLSQIVTNHPPVLLPLNLTRTAGLGLHFTWSQLTNQWSDADGDVVTLTTFNLSTTNSVSLSTNATLIGYPSTAPNVADQINYTASDSYGDTVAGVINIAVNAYVTGTNSIVNITTGNPTTLKAYGVIGFSYITERSTNLTDWASIATNTVSTNGVIYVSDSFSDLGGTPPSSAYYRIKWQP